MHVGPRPLERLSHATERNVIATTNVSRGVRQAYKRRLVGISRCNLNASAIRLRADPVVAASTFATVRARYNSHDFSLWLIVRLGAVNAPRRVLILVEVVWVLQKPVEPRCPVISDARGPPRLRIHLARDSSPIFTG